MLYAWYMSDNAQSHWTCVARVLWFGLRDDPQVPILFEGFIFDAQTYLEYEK